MEKIRTLFISDVHLGTKKCQAESLLEVFKNYEFEQLIIVGDFIDLTALKRKFYWKESHSTVIQKILRFSRKGIKVNYILGNHDHYLRGLIKESNLNIGEIEISDEMFYSTIKGDLIYICHGDQFDGFVRLHPFLYMIGDFAYELSFKINTIYNKIRKIFGLEYWSLSKFLKSKVKDAISFVNDFKMLSLRKLKEVECDSIMIGHIHTPAIEKIEDKNYYNTGDFCESCSYIIEDLEGNIILRYINKETF
jgi:UDP-2,3-diacylglucosamine pyrophosphatase LpxH